ncbi:hypothetical protein AAG906_040160 [Vitis piasezkii]
MVPMITKNQKGSFQLRVRNKGETMQNLDLTCSICGKKHWGKPCYKKSGACFDCGKHRHMIYDFPKNKKFMIGKPKEDNKEDKQKPRVQGLMFAMTHQDAQVAFDVVIGGIQIYKLLLEDIGINKNNDNNNNNNNNS